MAKNFPLPLPKGWFRIALSDELAVGAVLPLHVADQELVLFRTMSGQAVLMDAFCPHLGAHRGIGGRVEGERLICPFHAWEFDRAGACVAIPYAKRIPPKAARASGAVPVVERNRLIYAWFDPAGSAPTWEPAIIPELAGDQWSAFATHRWTIRAQAQELAENVIDSAHFRYVHGTATVPNSTVSFDGHALTSINRAKMDTPRGTVDGGIDIVQEGLTLTFSRFSGICDLLLITSSTPIDAQTCDVMLTFAVNESEGFSTEKGVGAAIIRDIVKQMNEDIPVWENKIYLDRPNICDGDGAVGPFRRWAKQFYPESDAFDAVAAE